MCIMYIIGLCIKEKRNRGVIDRVAVDFGDFSPPSISQQLCGRSEFDGCQRQCYFPEPPKKQR